MSMATENDKCQTQVIQSIEKPILFSASMVQAILSGKKWMTRRIVPQRILDKWYEYEADCSPLQSPESSMMPEREFYLQHCRFRPPDEFYEGDILWVRETWCKEYYSQLVEPENHPSPLNENAYRYRYKASNDLPDGMPWRSSIFMSREAARIFLKVTDVRVEHLQDITEEDAEHEGVERCDLDYTEKLLGHRGYVAAFEQLWDHLNKKSGYGWENNPWVYVIEFERNK